MFDYSKFCLISYNLVTNGRFVICICNITIFTAAELTYFGTLEQVMITSLEYKTLDTKISILNIMQLAKTEVLQKLFEQQLVRHTI